MRKLYFIAFISIILNSVVYAQCNHECEYHKKVSLENFKKNINISQSGSMSQSKSGYIEIQDESGNWSKQYYYIYFYQYAYLYKGRIQNENHNMNLNGFLSKGSYPWLVEYDPSQDCLIYENEHYLLRVPYKNGKPIYFKQKVKGKDFYSTIWQVLD